MRCRAAVVFVTVWIAIHSQTHAAKIYTLLPHHSADTPQGSEGGFWKIDENFDPTIHLKNVLLYQPIDVVPSLYFADGTEYRLSTVHLAPAGVAAIRIRSVLQAMPAGLKTHASTFGMVGVNYRWSWPAVITTIQNTDEIASLTNHSSANVNAPEVHASTDNVTTRTIYGTWWLPTPAADGFLALSNVSMAPRHAHVQFTNAAGEELAKKEIHLPRHATVVLRLTDLLGNIQGKDSAGGIIIRYHGASDSVQAHAGIEDEALGYSAIPYLAERRNDDAGQAAHPIVLNAPGVMLGTPDPAMHFPADTHFTPYSVLHNVSARQLSITLSLTASVQNASPITQTIERLTLQPGQTLAVDYSSYFSKGRIVPNGFANLSVAFQGEEGDLLFDAGSIDQSQTYVFEVTTTEQALSASKTICYWSLEGDTDSMIAIWNWSSASQDLVLTLYYSGGQYQIPIHLDARQSYNLDMMDLVRSEVPDATGSVIPSTITSGSALLASTQGEINSISVATSTAVYNVRNATCGTTCETCNGVTELDVIPTPLGLISTTSSQLTPQAKMNTGGTYNPNNGTWQSQNANIVAVNTTGMATGHTPGSSSVSVYLDGIYTGAGYICEGTTFTCPTGNFQGTSPTTVSAAPQITSINPSSLTLGASGVMTISGSGFTSVPGPANVVFSGGGITTSAVTVRNNTSITLSYQVTCGSPLGAQSLHLNFPNGDGVNSNSIGYSVILPSAPAPTVKFNGNVPTGTQSVVVGQQIALTASESLPACMSLSGQQWSNPPGTAVAGYSASTAGGSVNTNIATTNSSMTFYWVYPGSGYGLSYHYTMTANGQSTSSPSSTVAFNVAGVSAQGMTLNNEVLVNVDDLTGCAAQSGGPNLVYGKLSGTVPACGNPSGTPGIQFFRQGTGPSAGNFIFAQVINSDTTSNGYNGSGQTYTCTSAGGIDGAYPYQNSANPTTVSDAPLSPLVYNPTASRAFNASMYLLWQSTSTTNTIPVPLGYIPWTVNGSASCGTAPCNVASDWTPSGNGGPTSQFVASTPTQAHLGYPTWGGPATFTCSYH